MFTLYLALPNRETILNVLSLLFYIGSASFIPHLQSRGPVADKDEPPAGIPPPVSRLQRARSKIVRDGFITDWDIYLHSPHCESQMEWV